MATPVKNLSLLSSRLSPRNISSFVTSPIKQRTPNSSRNLNIPAFQNFQKISPGFPKLSRKIDVPIDTPQKIRICQDGIREEKSFQILGRGSFGKVFRATYKGKTVAMKLIPQPSPLRESNALRLSHGNIVRILDIIRNDPGKYSMVIMEYCKDSKSLQEIIQDLNPDFILEYSLGITAGLEYCHSRRILHLDMKPGNVLVCDGICKIADFGNSLDLLDENQKDFKHQGTIFYSAPELTSGKFPTEKCDVYSLGITFWQMRSRRNPYEDFNSHEEVLYKVVKYGLRPETLSPEDAYSAIYRKCWDKDAGNRPTALQVLQMLQNQLKQS